MKGRERRWLSIANSQIYSNRLFKNENLGWKNELGGIIVEK